MCNGIAQRCMLLTLGRKIPGLKCHSGYRWAGKSTHSWEWWQLCIQTLAARDTEIAEAESLQALDRQNWDENQQGEGLGGCCRRAAGSSLFKRWCCSVSGISYGLKINRTRISAYGAARPVRRSAQRAARGAEGTTALSWPWVPLACLCTSGCGRVNSCKPWLGCVAVATASKPRHGVSAQSHPGALSPWSWHGHYILHCFVSYRLFYKCFRAGLEYRLVFTLPPKRCVGLFFGFFFSCEKVKMSASNLGWLSPKQNISVLSAGTKRSVSNHFWQHIKLRFYLSLKLACPLGLTLSLESNMLFSIWKPGKKVSGWITGTET